MYAKALTLGMASGVDLLIEEIRTGLVVELHVCQGTRLLDELDVLDQKRVVLRSDCESPNLRLTEVAEKQQLRPRGRGEAKDRRKRLRRPHSFRVLSHCPRQGPKRDRLAPLVR